MPSQPPMADIHISYLSIFDYLFQHIVPRIILTFQLQRVARFFVNFRALNKDITIFHFFQSPDPSRCGSPRDFLSLFELCFIARSFQLAVMVLAIFLSLFELCFFTRSFQIAVAVRTIFVTFWFYPQIPRPSSCASPGDFLSFYEILPFTIFPTHFQLDWPVFVILCKLFGVFCMFVLLS